MKKTVLSRRKSLRAQQKVKPPPKETASTQNDNVQTPKKTETLSESKTEPPKPSVNVKKDDKGPERKLPGRNKFKKGLNSNTKTTELKKDFKKVTDLKKESTSVYEKDKEKKQINRSLDIRKEISKSTDIKKNVSKTVQIKRSTRISNVIEKVNLKPKNVKKTELRRTTRHENAQTRKDSSENQNVAEAKPKNKVVVTKTESKPSTRSQETKKNDTDNNLPKADVNTSNIPKIKSKTDNVEPIDKPIEKLKKEPIPHKVNEDKKEAEKEMKKKVDVPVVAEDETKQDVISTVKNKPSVTVKSKKDIEKNDELKKESITKAKTIKLERDVSPKTIQRPSRKTKEAAAIYMEILSHKLVNDGRIDDDNVSIDSFPELPNVKRTEQRENELKAKAKKEDCVQKDNPPDEIVEIPDKKNVQEDIKNVTNTENVKQDVKLDKDVGCEIELNAVEEKNEEVDIKCDKEIDESIPAVENIPIEEEKVSKHFNQVVENIINEIDVPDEEKMEISEKAPEINSSIENPICEETNKDPANTPVIDESLNSCQEPLEKTEEVNKSEPIVAEKDVKKTTKEEVKENKTEPEAKEVALKRKTRNTILSKTGSAGDSDQSFHLNVKVPRKKKMTRSKTQPKTSKVEEKTQEALSKEISSESDESTSDVNLQALANRQKNKKYTKKRPVKKIAENTFCDSDEEPLSKLTSKVSESPSGNDSLKGKLKSTSNKKESKPEPKVKVVPEVVKTEPEVKETTKPKRECAKRPQNYLPMLSSSDDEDIFHGFDEKAAAKNTKAISNPSCSHTPPLLDFLTKDIGRRWGKEKVNMSNEQIEKWLKESALAGSSIKKENDEMLKFGERIPTETPEPVEGDSKKIFQIDSETSSKMSVSKMDPAEKVDNKDFLKQQLDSVKPKLIFRKHKIDSAPNVNAFSPENESSVYAFGEETEELISTPFRRPSRRPSSTATSRSEDESSKNDESMKGGKFLNVNCFLFLDI